MMQRVVVMGMLLGAFGTPALTAEEPFAVQVAYSPKLRSTPGWIADLDCAFSRAGAILEKAIGRGLVVHRREPWFGGAVGRTPRELRQALVADVERGDADLVVGLSIFNRRPPPGPRPPGVPTEQDLDFTVDEGLAHYTEGYVVLNVRSGEICDIYRLLAHEIAHLFGGVHRRGGRWLMDPDGNGVEVDPLNAALLALHRGRRFGAGQAPLAGDDLRRMWRLAAAELDDARTWYTVGVLAARLGKTEDAALHYGRALELDPRHRPSLVDLGHVRFQRGELREAEKLYREALELADDGLVRNNLAAVYYGLDEPAAAALHLDRARQLGYAVDPRFVAELETSLAVSPDVSPDASRGPKKTRAFTPWRELERVSTSQGWFEVYRVAPRVLAIYEPGHEQKTISYLLDGDERALLFDTGLGHGDLAALVAELTERPVSVLNSHTHGDHIGGNHRFAHILGVDAEFTRANSRGRRNADGSWRIHPFDISRVIEDGERIELGGGWEVEVLLTPGHAPDALCLLDRRNRLLFTGDTFYLGQVYAHLEHSDLDDYQRTTFRLASLAPQIDFLLPGHLVTRVAGDFLRRFHQSFKRLLDRQGRPLATGTPGVVGYRFSHYTILVRERDLPPR